MAKILFFVFLVLFIIGLVMGAVELLSSRLGRLANNNWCVMWNEVDKMPEWTNKDERQYEYVKESELERGKPEEAAQEVAARTVNKQRREEGRTPSQTTQGTGNPNTSLEDRTVEELRNRAAELKIKGRSKMKKVELVEAIRNAG